MLLYKYFAVKYKLRRPTGLLFLSLSSFAIVAANGEITKIMDLEKEETMKNCSLAWPGHSLHRALLLSAYTESNNALRKREVWLVSHDQPLFLQTTHPRHAKSVRSTGKRGWLRKIRRTAAKKRWIRKVFPAVKIKLTKYAAQHGIWWL